MKLYFILFISLILMFGCSGTSEEDAEQTTQPYTVRVVKQFDITYGGDFWFEIKLEKITTYNSSTNEILGIEVYGYLKNLCANTVIIDVDVNGNGWTRTYINDTYLINEVKPMGLLGTDESNFDNSIQMVLWNYIFPANT